MGLEDTNVIRTWLETNFKQALLEGDQAVATFRANVAAMGPDVEQVFGQIEGTTAVVSASVGESLAAMGVMAEKTAGVGEGEAGVSGFAKLTANMLKAERTGLALATGQGLMRAGPMLETLALAAGGPAGVGMAIGGVAMALEVMLPKLEAWIGKMDGAAEATKRAADALKRYNDEAEKANNAPSVANAESAKEISAGLLAGEGERGVRQGVRYSLRQEGFGLTPEEQAQLNDINRRIALGQNMSSFLGIKDILERKQQGAISSEEGRLLEGLKRGDQGAIGDVQGMAGQMPGEFPADTAGILHGATPAGRAEAQQRLAAVHAQAESTSMKNAANEKKRADDERKTLQQQAKTDADNARDRTRRNAEWDRDVAAQTREEDKDIRDEATANKHAADKAKVDAKHAATLAAHAAAKADHDNTPERAKQRAIQGEIMNQGGATADPDFVRQVAAQASRNVTMGADLASAVTYAVQQTEAKIYADFARGMAQQNQTWQNLGAR